jgi:hypothetical protein
MALSVGMQADYASLIDKHQPDSLKMIREADKYAKKLLVVAPDAADAYLGLGRRITSSGVCRNSRSFFSASLDSTPTRKEASSSSRSLLQIGSLKNELTYWKYWQTTCGPFVSRVFKIG